MLHKTQPYVMTLMFLFYICFFIIILHQSATHENSFIPFNGNITLRKILEQIKNWSTGNEFFKSNQIVIPRKPILNHIVN